MKQRHGPVELLLRGGVARDGKVHFSELFRRSPSRRIILTVSPCSGGAGAEHDCQCQCPDSPSPCHDRLPESVVRGTKCDGILSTPFHKYGCIRAPLNPLQLRCAPCAVLLRVRLSRTPRWRGASTLSVRHRIYEAEYYGSHVITAVMRRERMRRRPNAPVSVIGSARRFPPGLRAGPARGGQGRRTATGGSRAGRVSTR